MRTTRGRLRANDTRGLPPGSRVFLLQLFSAAAEQQELSLRRNLNLTTMSIDIVDILNYVLPTRDHVVREYLPSASHAHPQQYAAMS